VDLQLSEEQRWLAESLDELLARTDAERVWSSLVDFGALEPDLGAVELALVARGIGAHLTAVPFAETAAVRRGDSPIALVRGEKSAVAYAASVEWFAVASGPTLAIVPAAAAEIEPLTTLDPTLGTARVRIDEAAVGDVVVGADDVFGLAGVLVSAEAVGAAAAVLELAREYATQRRQFGRPIGGFQAVRHILADMYVEVESSWSSVLYAAAALDEREADSLQTASIAKAYAARSTHDVAHGALQVFGGVAFTAEHPAHRFLRRIVVRGSQFGSAREHERAIGRALAATFVSVS
jgi:alkylation response protein AidB-like acyl-CoA dehydrogenase